MTTTLRSRSSFYKPAEEPLLDPFNREEIEEDETGKDQIERQWRFHKPEVSAERRVGKYEGQQNN
jgi:hypothetical protein